MKYKTQSELITKQISVELVKKVWKIEVDLVLVNAESF